MTTASTVVYSIDSRDRLTEVNEAWELFAAENDGAHLPAEQVLGQSLWGYVTDSTTQQLYQRMLQRLRQGGKPIEFLFRCDAPALRRMLAMKMMADESGVVQFSVRPVLEESRADVALLQAGRAAVRSVSS